jgi:cell division FtsZ-interacting protein ZapD
MTAFQRQVMASLTAIHRKLGVLHAENQREGELIMATWNDIKEDVRETQDASQALMKVLDNVRLQLAELASKEFVDPAELQAVHDDLDKNTADMVAKALEGTGVPTDPHAASM